MTPLKIAALTLLGGVVLGAGFSYAWRRTPRVFPPVSAARIAPIADWQAALTRSDDAVQALMDQAAEVEVELVDADFDEGEGYDTVSFDDLGAQWLARATQTSGARVSPSYGDADELDPHPSWKPGRRAL
jgi:hypothetical protein